MPSKKKCAYSKKKRANSKKKRVKSKKRIAHQKTNKPEASSSSTIKTVREDSDDLEVEYLLKHDSDNSIKEKNSWPAIMPSKKKRANSKKKHVKSKKRIAHQKTNKPEEDSDDSEVECWSKYADNIPVLLACAGLSEDDSDNSIKEKVPREPFIKKGAELDAYIANFRELNYARISHWMDHLYPPSSPE